MPQENSGTIIPLNFAKANARPTQQALAIRRLLFVYDHNEDRRLKILFDKLRRESPKSKG